VCVLILAIEEANKNKKAKNLRIGEGRRAMVI